MTLEKSSPCKINLLLNVLGPRADGFHELETVLQPVSVCDRLRFRRGGAGLRLTCTEPSLSTDAGNLVHRAATAFLAAAQIQEGLQIDLEKTIPLAAGLGGGSGNAATALLGLNELFGHPLPAARLQAIAASLGSDVPFFLQSGPALATGRGEKIEPCAPFPALRGAGLLLVHPGFGISTAWAYQRLARHPEAAHGRPGRARRLIALLQTADLHTAGAEFYNALEAPALAKYPILAMYQEFLRANGAAATLMSGSGSTTFALVPGVVAARELETKFRRKFGDTCWTAAVAV